MAAAVAKHTSAPSKINALSKSDRVPPHGTGSEKVESQEELDARMRNLMTQSDVVLFMKGSPNAPRCGFSKKIAGLLKDQKIEFSHFDILTDENVRQGMCLVYFHSRSVHIQRKQV